MSELEMVSEDLERHEHIKDHPKDNHARRAGLLIACLAVALAFTDMGKDSASSSSQADHLEANDTWLDYSQKSVRAAILESQVTTLSLGANASDPAVVKAISAAKAGIAKLNSDEERGRGKKQLQEVAEKLSEASRHSLHRYHMFELCFAAISIAIVLVSASVITRVMLMLAAGALLGAVGAMASGAIWAGLL